MNYRKYTTDQVKHFLKCAKRRVQYLNSELTYAQNRVLDIKVELRKRAAINQEEK